MANLMLFPVAAGLLLLVAAARDIATRLIPDGIPIAIAAVGLVTRAMVGWQEAALSLAVAALLFAALFAVAMRGWLGGGDVKLVSAMAVGLAPSETWLFVVTTVFAGGILGVAYILARYVVPETRVVAGGSLVRRVLAVEAWRVRRRGPLPYAVAIAIGGIFVLYTLAGV
ncbi:prepilin peptidase [Roseomonas terrae]|uniref:Prepilin peptidase n=1 Tax=Neoroseomonas terrae TaxID=424799 RepID=A0ABS5EMR1_9PROT|nr:prepilin peptidase [Neoroseomonas terrae]MBR0652315.1 prepilin peptidase [Neoroseomonas terrae]